MVSRQRAQQGPSLSWCCREGEDCGGLWIYRVVRVTVVGVVFGVFFVSGLSIHLREVWCPYIWS